MWGTSSFIVTNLDVWIPAHQLDIKTCWILTSNEDYAYLQAQLTLFEIGWSELLGMGQADKQMLSQAIAPHL